MWDAPWESSQFRRRGKRRTVSAITKGRPCSPVDRSSSQLRAALGVKRFPM